MVPVLYHEKIRVGQEIFFSMIFSWFEGLNKLEMHNLLFFRLRVFTMKILGHKLVMYWLAYRTF